MKIKRGFMMRKVGQENIVLPIDSKKMNFNGMVKLNATAAELWNFFQSEHTKQEAISYLVKKYEIDEETATLGVEKFLETIKAGNFAE